MEVLGVTIDDSRLKSARDNHEKYMADREVDKLEFVRTLATLIWPDVEGSLRRSYDMSLSFDERVLNAWTYLVWNSVFKLDIKTVHMDKARLLRMVHKKPSLALLWHSLVHNNVSKDVAVILEGTEELEPYVRACIAFQIEKENTKNPAV